MVRAPCCEKMGLKKGPWTAEEDQILITFIQNHGHGNWRALPKLAGLLRCGKSCRLRWTNYLRPDIKRGNFTREEEDAIINLHQMLGNRWSAIAAKLPGRTDNEIKNVWHTHLKKRLTKTDAESGQGSVRKTKIELKEEMPTQSYSSTPEPSSSSSTVEHSQNSMESFSHDEAEAQGIDESFWTEVLKMDTNDEYYYNSSDSMAMEGIISSDFSDEKFWLSAGGREEDDDLSFWLRIFLQAEELPQI